MRYLYTVARAAALVAVLLLAAPIAASANPADEALAKKVSEQLMENKSFDATNIIVTAKEGVVQLRGEVKKASDLKAIEEAAKGIPGVQRVETEVDVMGQKQ